jgi:hypothetical protein
MENGDGRKVLLVATLLKEHTKRQKKTYWKGKTNPRYIYTATKKKYTMS